jgi:uncharacterized protein (DUF1499 family)
MFFYIPIGLTIFFVACVRIAPSDPNRWHVSIEEEIETNFAGGAVRILPNGPEALKLLNTMMLNIPRTKVLAGSLEQGRITYITRTKLIGFPDYTTIENSDGIIKLFARLRFGTNDLGVNAARLERLKRAFE